MRARRLNFHNLLEHGWKEAEFTMPSDLKAPPTCQTCFYLLHQQISFQTYCVWLAPTFSLLYTPLPCFQSSVKLMETLNSVTQIGMGSKHLPASATLAKHPKNLLLKCLFSSKSQRDPGVPKLKLLWQRMSGVIKILKMVSELTGPLVELSLKVQLHWLPSPSGFELDLSPSVTHSVPVSHSSMCDLFHKMGYRNTASPPFYMIVLTVSKPCFLG